MRRLSHSIADLVSNIDALSGKFSSIADGDAEDSGGLDIPRELFFGGLDELFSMSANALEYLFAKPIYDTENLILGIAESPGWTYSDIPGYYLGVGKDAVFPRR